MSRTEAQYVPAHTKYVARSQYFSHSTKQRPMNTLAVDPVLLYAKLEVAKLEQDAARRAYKERKQRAAAKEEQDAAKRASVLETRNLLKESLRRSMPADCEYMADGKPCINTAQLLAALQTSPPLRHGSVRTTGASRDLSTHRDSSSGGSTENDVKEVAGRRRRFKAEEGPFKLVPIKHGSQTTYERVDIPVDTGLIEDREDAEDEHGRPKLSKYDRPHWAQQSQNTTATLKSKLQGVTTGRSRPAQEVPAEVRQATQAQDTMIADAVNQIKKEQRTRKLHTVSHLFKKS